MEAATQVEGEIEFRTLDGKKGTAKARYYIVCCGGIDTARLLLASKSVQPNGAGNQNDLVGKVFSRAHPF